jgi:hypothetical protein
MACACQGESARKLLQRLVLGGARAESEERRLEALSAAVLDEPARVEERVCALARQGQAGHQLAHERHQALARICRRHLGHRLGCHAVSSRRMTAVADTLRRGKAGPCPDLTKSY